MKKWINKKRILSNVWLLIIMLLILGVKNRNYFIDTVEMVLHKVRDVREKPEETQEYINESDNDGENATSHLGKLYERLTDEGQSEALAAENTSDDKTADRERGQPVTDAIIPLKDLYYIPGSEAYIEAYRPEAGSYTWEIYDAESGLWKIENSRMTDDELSRHVSRVLLRKDALEPYMIRCTMDIDGIPMEEIATVHPITGEISSIEKVEEFYEVNGETYVSAEELPVRVIYRDGSMQEIESLSGLCFVKEESYSEYSSTASGNRIETVTKIITEYKYSFSDMSEKEVLLRFRNGNEIFDMNIKMKGRDLKSPTVLKVECGDFNIGNTTDPIPVPIKITAVDNYSSLEELEYAFIPAGRNPEKEDWKKESFWDAMIDQNGIWKAYVRDQEGNIGEMERELLVSDTAAPVIRGITETIEIQGGSN